MAGQIYLVRHGDYDRGPERLSQEGIKQSNEAAESLRERGLGSKAVILSSSAPRAMETAGIISEGLDQAKLYGSESLKFAGEVPEAVESFKWLVDTVFMELKVSDPEYEGLVVVAHLPLIRAIEGGRSIKYAEVVEYDPSHPWENGEYWEGDRRISRLFVESA